MADPFSIVTGCVGLIGTAAATINAITSFVRDCRTARGDLTVVARELTDLQLILELLKDDGQGDTLPSPLQDQINHIVKSCSRIVSDIKLELKRCEGKSGAVAWAADGKKAVEGLRRDLATNRVLLSYNVELTTLFIAKSIKEDTEVIRGAVLEIKHGIERILQEKRDSRTAYQTGNQSPTANVLLDNYLDGLTTYAETVCEEVVWETDGEDEETNSHTVTDEPRTAAPTTVETYDLDVEDRESSPQSTPLEGKCHDCESIINPEESRRNPCDHWLCDKCINVRFKESTRHPYPTPKCCGWRLSLKQAEPTFDDKFKKRFNHFWGRTTVMCPRESCGKRNKGYRLRSSPPRESIHCHKCDQQICSWCENKWHKKGRPLCTPQKRLLPLFD